jgi:hypothetical protein
MQTTHDDLPDSIDRTRAAILVEGSALTTALDIRLYLAAQSTLKRAFIILQSTRLRQ